MTSDLSWERTHKIGGVLFVILGLLMVATTILDPTTAIWILIIAGVAITLFLFVYSYRAWKEDPSKH